MSLEKISAILDKQRLIENMVHSQAMPKHELVEDVVHRQHLAELQNLLVKLDAEEIAHVLTALDVADARMLWQQLTTSQEAQVMPLLDADLGHMLLENKEIDSFNSQIHAFELVGDRLQQIGINNRKELDNIKPVWIDLLNPSKAERHYVGVTYGLELPDPEDGTDLEVTSRFRIEEDGDIVLHANFLLDKSGDSRSVPVTFILHQGILFSVRNEDLPVFRLQRLRARTQPGYVSDCLDVLLDLYGADVEYSADSLEDIYGTLGKVGRQVLSETISDTEAARILSDIAEEEDLNGRIRSNILDTQRALSFMLRCKLFSASQVDDVKQIMRNIESLNSHTAFLFDKINFLMDATIGFININQNRRVTQLTVFGVVFMPINIFAGIGGMSEFSMMTHNIPWPIAYGAFVVTMGLIGWGTYLGLRHLETRKLKQASKQVLLDRDNA
ncbi:magnesium and cobalt transport protein CorA [Leeia sp. TBRC 13508]|uniref:Magnesium and cobalt transport protein CorA n=1 Tax=Leeia speluncae TaxID=2884804 RepID=A0ABS8D929_9NEIS|nr:magnesium and cobalt transport protein CorA [Leeia speluncae]MCB6184701.1 magnesium and cobalt transport protein CorA [Leeia speluncae]